METRSSRSPDAGSILGLVGGALLIIGSLMTWATVSVNVGNIAKAVGVDPSTIPAGAFPDSQSFAGTGSSDGKVALACGVLALIAAVLVIMTTGRTVAAVVLMVGGLVGGGFALYDGLTGKDKAIDEGVKGLSALGLPGDVKSFFDVSIGIGIWVCVAGGLVALVAGIMVLANRSPSAAMVPQTGSPMGMGTGVPASTPETSGGVTPTPAMPPVPPVPPMNMPEGGEPRTS
jgi:hypothetical protein